MSERTRPLPGLAFAADHARVCPTYMLQASAQSLFKSLASLNDWVNRFEVSSGRMDMALTSEHASASRAKISVVVSKASTSFSVSLTVLRVATRERLATLATAARYSI